MEGRKDNMPQLYTLILIDSLFCQKKLDVAIKQVKKKKKPKYLQYGRFISVQREINKVLMMRNTITSPITMRNKTSRTKTYLWLIKILVEDGKIQPISSSPIPP